VKETESETKENKIFLSGKKEATEERNSISHQPWDIAAGKKFRLPRSLRRDLISGIFVLFAKLERQSLRTYTNVNNISKLKRIEKAKS